jgi:hypothetical protein
MSEVSVICLSPESRVIRIAEQTGPMVRPDSTSVGVKIVGLLANGPARTPRPKDR